MLVGWQKIRNDIYYPLNEEWMQNMEDKMKIDFDIDDSAKPESTAITFRAMDLDLSRKSLEVYLEEVNKLKDGITSLVVEDEASQIKAVEYGSMAQGLLKKIDATKEEIIKEPKAFVSSVRKIAGPFEDALEKIKQIAGSKIKQYKAVIEQKRREDEAKLQAEAKALEEKLKKQAKATGTIPVSVPVPIIPKVKEVVRTEFGSQSSAEHWVFEVKEPFLENIILVPGDCLMLNEKNVRAKIKMGIREIPGLNIKQDDSIKFRG